MNKTYKNHKLLLVTELIAIIQKSMCRGNQGEANFPDGQQKIFITTALKTLKLTCQVQIAKGLHWVSQH